MRNRDDGQAWLIRGAVTMCIQSKNKFIGSKLIEHDTSQTRGNMRRNIFLTWAIVTALLVHSVVFGQEFEIKNNGGSRVSFVSDAPLETITGVTSKLKGVIHIDSKNLKKSTGKIEVSVASLKTGIDLRDEHLRGPNWLDSQNYPTITYELTRLDGPTSLAQGKTTTFQAKGKLTLHGITKQVPATVKIRIIPFSAELGQTPGINNDVIRVRARFKINLADFGIKVPTIVKLKVSEEIFCTANLRGIKVDKKNIEPKK